MSDDLARELLAEYARHWCKEAVIKGGMIRVVCKCGKWETTRKPGAEFAVAADADFLTHQSAALAATARAFIADEIMKQFGVTDTIHHSDFTKGWMHGMLDAESIARGDTK